MHPEWVCPMERCPEDGPLQGECWGQQEGNLGIATPPFSPDKLLLLSSDWGDKDIQLKTDTNILLINVTVNYWTAAFQEFTFVGSCVGGAGSWHSTVALSSQCAIRGGR